MDLLKYTEWVNGRVPADVDNRKVFRAYGIAGEVGEVLEIIKKHYYHRRPLDLADLVLEMGDVLWYGCVNLHLKPTLSWIDRRYPDLPIERQVIPILLAGKTLIENAAQDMHTTEILESSPLDDYSIFLGRINGYLIAAGERPLQLQTLIDANVAKLIARYGHTPHNKGVHDE